MHLPLWALQVPTTRGRLFVSVLLISMCRTNTLERFSEMIKAKDTASRSVSEINRVDVDKHMLCLGVIINTWAEG